MSGREFPVSDSHMHVNPVNGMGASLVIKKFINKGGWFASLVMLPTWDYGALATDLNSFNKYLDVHVKECGKARSMGLKVSCFAGFHPAEIDRLLEKRMPPKRVLDHGLMIIDNLFNKCEKGEIDGVGELGRQHYKTSVPAILIAERLLQYSINLSRDKGCKMQLHLENQKGFTSWDIEEKITSAKVKDHVIIHHARASILEEIIGSGLWATTPAILGNLEASFRKIRKTNDYSTLLIESDYIDDPKRPGVVVEPWKIGDNLRKLVLNNIIDEDDAYKLMVENVVKFFGVDAP